MNKTIGMGSILVGIQTKGKTTTICITDVLYVLKLQANLFLVSKFLSKGLKAKFYVIECILRGVNGNVVAIAQSQGKLYQMTFKEICGAHSANLVDVWYHQLR
jgi:hypothetical protein